MVSTEYSQSLYELSYGDGIEHYWWHLARSRIVMEELQRFGCAAPKVLDVGCGRGITVDYLRHRGIECDGVELGIAHPLESVSDHVRYGVDAVDLPETERASYNVISLLDVIEHLPEPVAFIHALVKAYPHVSRLIVTVPACPELWSNYDQTFGHYRRYTLATIKELADTLQLELLNLSYFFHALYVPARLLAAMKKKRSTRVRTPQGWRRPLHRLLGVAMWLDYKIVPSRLPGMSAVAMLRVR